MIILTSYVMAPRNVMGKISSNVSIEDAARLAVTSLYFKAACRSVVGYKQLADRSGLSIKVEKPVVEKEVVQEVINPIPVKVDLTTIVVEKPVVVIPTIEEDYSDVPENIRKLGKIVIKAYLNNRSKIDENVRQMKEEREEQQRIAEEQGKEVRKPLEWVIAPVVLTPFQESCEAVLEGIKGAGTITLSGLETLLKEQWNALRGSCDITEEKKLFKQFCIDIRAEFINLSANEEVTIDSYIVLHNDVKMWHNMPF